MDGSFGFDRDDESVEEVSIEAPPPVIGGAERRLHVRAYEQWRRVALLRGRTFPAVQDLDCPELEEFEPRSVLIDYRGGMDDARIVRIGKTLADESGADGSIACVRDVPRGSLLSRLTDHYLEIIASRTPIGFEAEFVNHRGWPTLYRGILMPLSADGETIDHVLGVINWKHDLPSDLALDLQRELKAVSGWTSTARH